MKACAAEPVEPTAERPGVATPSPGVPSGGDAGGPRSKPVNGGLVVDVSIGAGEVSPVGRTLHVNVGEQIRLRVDSEVKDELHVHSQPERKLAVEVGQDQVFAFTLDLPGQVIVESHETGTVILKLVVNP